ncbi:MAG TPA: hypothetical protein VLA09_04415, partial [Longimicrobiales bacterium]|nr:hypothetical protein [Longimicrobiales bacterium]
MSLIRRAPLALLAILAASCTDATKVEEASDPWNLGDLPPSLAVVASLPAVCGAPTVTTLIADEVVGVGSVEVTQSGTHLYVVYRTDPGWPIHKTALFVGASAEEIPTNGAGNPRVGQFPYEASHDGPNEVIWEVPLSSLASSDVVVAAFAEVGPVDDPEGAWGEGEEITPGRSWATFFTYEVSGCVGETVDQGGGTVTTPAGDASLTIAPGALAEPVDITIAPATVDDLLEHASTMGEPSPAGPADAPGTGGAAPAPALAELELPTLFGVTPVEGTIWDLGPDGLEFLRPATLVLEYDESALPEGATEEDLGVYVINGIFEQLPSTTDTEANTITAEIGHFTLAFTAVDLGESLDLELTSFSQLTSSDPEVGQPVEFSAEVRNNGPGTGQATVLYQVQGPVLLGDVADSCREVDPDFGDFAVSCALPFLGVGDFESAAAFQVIPLQGGEVVTVRATAVPAGQDRDENPDNDTRELGFTAGGGGGAIADLRAGGGPSSGSDPRVGGLMEWVGRVDNLGPGASSGGTMVLAANGDIVLGDVPADCTTQFDIPGILASIECPVDPLAAFGIDLVGPLRFTAQSAGDIEVWATVTPASGDTDPNPDNDEASTTITVAETFLVDLAPTSQSFGGVPGPEGALTFRARVGNFLPPSHGGVMIYEAIGDAIFGSVDNSCTASVPSPSVLRLLCPFDPFPTALTDAPVAFIQVVPQSNGVVTFRATTVPVAGDTDVDPSNDQLEVGVA